MNYTKILNYISKVLLHNIFILFIIFKLMVISPTKLFFSPEMLNFMSLYIEWIHSIYLEFKHSTMFFISELKSIYVEAGKINQLMNHIDNLEEDIKHKDKLITHLEYENKLKIKANDYSITTKLGIVILLVGALCSIVCFFHGGSISGTGFTESDRECLRTILNRSNPSDSGTYVPRFSNRTTPGSIDTNL